MKIITVRLAVEESGESRRKTYNLQKSSVNKVFEEIDEFIGGIKNE